MQRKPIVNNSNVWVGGDSFVQVIDASVKGLIDDLRFEVNIINNHTLTLIRLDYELIFYTSANQQINDEPFFVEGETVSIPANELGLASTLNISEIFPNASHADIRLISAHFEGDNTLDLVYERMEKMELNKLTDLEKELLMEVAGEDARSLPSEGLENWRCVCGYFNGSSVNCSNCGREKNMIFEEYSSIDKIKEKIENAMKEQMDKVEISNEEPEEEPKEEPKAIEEIVEETSEDENVQIKDFFDSIPKSQMIMLMSSGVMLMSSAIIWAMLRLN